MGQNESAQVSGGVSLDSSNNNSKKNVSSSTSRPIQRPAGNEADEYDAASDVVVTPRSNGKMCRENGKGGAHSAIKAPQHRKKKRRSHKSADASSKSCKNVAANDVELIVRKKLITTTTTTTMTPLDISMIGGGGSGGGGGATSNNHQNQAPSGENSAGDEPLRKSSSFGNENRGPSAADEDDNSSQQQHVKSSDHNEKTDQPPPPPPPTVHPPKIMNLITTQRIVNQKQANPSSTADAVHSINNLDSSTNNNVIISSTCSLQQISAGDGQGLDHVLADLNELKDQLKLDLCDNLTNGNGVLSSETYKSSESNVFIDEDRAQETAAEQLSNLVNQATGVSTTMNNANKLTSTVKKEQLEYEFRLKPKIKRTHKKKKGRSKHTKKRTTCLKADANTTKSGKARRRGSQGGESEPLQEDNSRLGTFSRWIRCSTNKTEAEEADENDEARQGVRCCCLCCGCRSHHASTFNSKRQSRSSRRTSPNSSCLVRLFSRLFFCFPSLSRPRRSSKYQRSDETDESNEQVAADRSLCCSKGGGYPVTDYHDDCDDDDDSGSGIYRRGRRSRRCILCVAIDCISAKKSDDRESSEYSDDEDEEEEDEDNGSQDDQGSNSNSDHERRINVDPNSRKVALKKKKLSCKQNRGDNHSDECDDLIENPPPVMCIRVLRPSNDLTPVRFDSHYNIIQSISTGSISGGGLGTGMGENNDEYNEEDELNAAEPASSNHQPGSTLVEANSSDEDEFAAGQQQYQNASAMSTIVNELNFDVIDGDEVDEEEETEEAAFGAPSNRSTADYYKISHTNQEKSF